MTLPTGYSWSAVGQPLQVPYEAPQGRRINALGAYFSHGCEVGRFEFATYASVSKTTAKRQRKTPEEIAAAHGVKPEVVGPIDSGRFLCFVWQVAGRPPVALVGWRRERPLVIVLDNYAVHKSQAVQAALPALEAANVFLFYLPAYSPELSEMEPIWRAVKGHGMPYRSQTVLGQMKQAVDEALASKAQQLWQEHQQLQQLQREQMKTTNFQCLAA
jgi:putative transposase